MTFLAPSFLLLLLLLPLLWFVPRRFDDVRHAVLRTLCLALLAVALAQPVLMGEAHTVHHTFVLDRSASVSADARRAGLERVEQLVQALPAGSRTAFVGIGESGDADGFDWSLALDEGTSLSLALAAAERTIPDGTPGAITLLTDGEATDRHAAGVLARLTARGIAVNVESLQTNESGVRLVALDVAGPVRVGHTCRVTVRVRGAAGNEIVRLLGVGGDLADPATLTAAGDHQIQFSFEPTQAGFVPITATVAAGEVLESDGTLARTLAVHDSLRTLYLGGRVENGAARLGELLGPGFQLDEAQSGDSTDVPRFADYDLVVLDDRTAAEFPASQQQALAQAVTDAGTGLLLSGGPAAFGPGGYHDTPIADVSPVEAVQREEKRDPSTTLTIIIDTSGSMGGNRVQLAKEVSRLAIRRLLPHDKVGIVEFFGSKRWAAPIQPASNSIELQRALNRLDAGGGTVILPAIEEAFYGMQNVQTRYKHVLVLTDGGVETGAFEPLLRKMAGKGMNVSTVLIGGNAHSEFLVTLANWGKGRFYSVPNRFNLPELMLKQPTTARLPAYRPGVHPVRARGGRVWWGDVSPKSIPPIAGYVQTRARKGAEVVLETAQGGHPVLASWRHGRGRVTALTTEPVGPGTEPWRDWSDYGAVLARALARTAADLDTPFTFRAVREHDRVRISAVRSGPGEHLPVVHLVGDALLEEVETAGAVVPLHERAPGCFTGEVWAPHDQDLRLLAGVADDPRGPGVRLVAAVVDDRLPERQVPRDGRVDLASIARSTGGVVLTARERSVPELTAAASPTVRSLAPWALLLALLVYLGDLLHRRRSRRGSRRPSTEVS